MTSPITEWYSDDTSPYMEGATHEVWSVNRGLCQLYSSAADTGLDPFQQAHTFFTESVKGL